MSEKRPPGQVRLAEALQKLRQTRASGREHGPPLDLRPTTPFEQEILHQYAELRRDYDELKKRVDWLTLAIVGAALTFVLETLFS